MYNQIWSPLKQEFVDTLSVEGRQALKMYVNSFMTGGAIKQEDIQKINDAATAVKDLTENLGSDNEDNLKIATAKSLQKVVNALKVGQEDFTELTEVNTGSPNSATILEPKPEAEPEQEQRSNQKKASEMQIREMLKKKIEFSNLIKKIETDGNGYIIPYGGLEKDQQIDTLSKEFKSIPDAFNKINEAVEKRNSTYSIETI